MHSSLFKELNLGDAINTNMTLQLIDHLIKKPYEVVENVLVKVDKLVFPIDFVILDFEQDRNFPLILWRPFHNIEKALIDVNKGKITLWVGKEKVEFMMNKLMQDVNVEEQYVEVDVIEKRDV